MPSRKRERDLLIQCCCGNEGDGVVRLMTIAPILANKTSVHEKVDRRVLRSRADVLRSHVVNLHRLECRLGLAEPEYPVQ